jgi:hypothetical protein
MHARARVPKQRRDRRKKSRCCEREPDTSFVMAFFAARLKPISQVGRSLTNHVLASLTCFQVLCVGARKHSIIAASTSQQLNAALNGFLPRCVPAAFARANAPRYKHPAVVCRRHFGFFDILRQKLKEEVEKNEDFRNKVKTAQETEAIKKASEAAAATKVIARRSV